MSRNHDPQQEIDRRAQQIQEDTGLDETTAREIAAQQLAQEARKPPPLRSIQPTDWYQTAPSQNPSYPPTDSSGRSLPATNDTPASPRCPICQGAGYLLPDVAYGHPQWGQLTACQCQREAQQRRALCAQTERTMQLIATLHGEMGALAGLSLESFDVQRALPRVQTWHGTIYSPEQQRQQLYRAASAAQSFAAAPAGWLFFTGSWGSGKSHLAAAILHTIAQQGTPCAYITASRLLALLRQGFGDKEYTTDDRLVDLQRVDVLLIDDLSDKAYSGWAESQLFDILNERCLAARPTIITANKLLDELPGRIASRIKRASAVHPAEILLIASDYGELPR
jgi:DNA replication protein DnaC